MVHVHNLFPAFGQQWTEDCGVPLVATLHNYRPLCANATLHRDGKGCTLCPDGQWWSSVRYGCYRNSRMATLPLVTNLRRGLERNPLFQHAQRLIVLSDRSKEIFEHYGVPTQRTVVIPNGLPDIPAPDRVPREGWTYAGRVSSEKGVLELVEEWPDGVPLSIAGDGPTSDLVRIAIRERPQIRMLGTLDSHALNRLMSGAVGVVIPSRWAEGLPLILGESLRVGTPVLARAGSSAADFVQRHGGGAVYSTGAELAEEVASWPGAEADASPRQVFQEHWSLNAWISRLESVYREVAL